MRLAALPVAELPGTELVLAQPLMGLDALPAQGMEPALLVAELPGSELVLAQPLMGLIALPAQGMEPALLMAELPVPGLELLERWLQPALTRAERAVSSLLASRGLSCFLRSWVPSWA